MDNPTILVADGDPKNLQILRESLEASGFEVIVASDGLQAWQKISSDVPDLILSEVNLPKLDGFQLLEKLKADPVTSSIPLMFLTNRRELQDRVRSLRGGVKDYMIKPLHVKEVIARVRMILRRMERIREEEIESTRKLAGRLEEFSVIDLIENFGMERKTGILTLYNANNKSGEIYFRDGAVINASLANLKAEKAVYQMLPWKRGHFTMTFKEINVPDEIAVSNLGLLLQGFKRMEERERLFKMLPSPETTFITTETFRNIITKRELTTDVAKFIALIDGRRDILQVIDESTYDDIKTLERLVKLYQQGFIKPNKTSPAGDEEIGEMVSTIAEPKIVQKLDLGASIEPRIAGRAPNKGTPPEIRSERPAPAKAFRAPEMPTYVPPERKPKDGSTITIETKRDLPAPSRPAPPTIEPPLKKLPPIETELPEASPIGFETFGEEEPPEEPPAKIKSRDARREPTARFSAPAAPPKKDGFDPDSLPIDLRDLMQRPTAPLPISDKPVAPRQPLPPVYEPPKVSPLIGELPPAEAKTAKADEAAPIFKTREEKSTPPAPPSIVEILDELILPAESESLAASEMTPAPSENTPTMLLVKPEPLPEIKEKAGDIAPRVEMPKPRAPIETPRAPDVPAMAPPIDQPAEMRLEPIIPPLPKIETPAAAPPIIEAKQKPSEPVVPSAPTHVTLPTPSISEAVVAPPSSQVLPLAPMQVQQASDTITACLARLLNQRSAAKPKLVIIGREGIQVSPMVRHLLGAESSLRRLQSTVFQYLEIGERKVESQPFEIIGISMEQQFTRLLDTAGADLIGYIVIVEAYRKEGLEYLSYLLNMLKNVYRRPLGIAVIKAADQKNMATETLRDLLNIGPTDFVQECVAADKLSVTEFLKGFTSEANLIKFA